MEKAKLEEILLEGLNLQRKLGLVSDSMELSSVRDSYMLWRKVVQDYFTKDDFDFISISKIFEGDNVFKTLQHGCGIDLKDPLAKEIVIALEIELKTKIDFIREFAKEYFAKSGNTLFSKKGGQYFYKGRPISLTPGNLSTDFFKIVVNNVDSDGFLAKSFVKEQLLLKGHEVGASTFRNVINNLFRQLRVDNNIIKNISPDNKPLFGFKGNKVRFYNPKN